MNLKPDDNWELKITNNCFSTKEELYKMREILAMESNSTICHHSTLNTYTVQWLKFNLRCDLPYNHLQLFIFFEIYQKFDT